MDIQDCGWIAYPEAYERQKALVEKVRKGREDIVLLCEHPAVVTCGRLTDQRNILVDRRELSRRGVEVYAVDRGGDVTAHGPGQLVIYPIMDLRRHGKDLRGFLRKLEQVAIDLLREFDIVAKRSLGRTGVWVGQKKIVSIGVGVRKWIAFHGLALNVNTDLSVFSVIRPCGLDVTMTSMREILQRPVSMRDVKKQLAGCLERAFGCPPPPRDAGESYASSGRA